MLVEASDSLGPIDDDLVSRVAHLFDLATDAAAIDAHLTENGLAANVARAPGVRVPGAFDGFELAMRAVLGQQVTVKGASTLMSRLAAALGEPVDTDVPALTHLTPTADAVASAGVTRVRAIGLPVARATTLVAIADNVRSGALRLDGAIDRDELMRQLQALPGIGPWTAQYIAMRVTHWSDAFPASDIALRRAAGDVSVAELTRMADRWRPFRAYAAMRLWLYGVAGGN